MFLALLGMVFIKDRSKWVFLGISVLALALSWGKNFMGLTDFFIENVTVTNYEYGEALLLKFNLCGSVADLFQKYKILNQWQLVCENPYSENSVEITSQGKILSHIQPSEAEISQYAVTCSTQIDLAPAEIENNLNSLLDALHKELFFLQISHPI